MGWPLSHLLVGLKPRALVLLDHHEHSLFSLERSLVSARSSDPGVAYELLDVRDARALERVFAEHHPEVVIHLAAAKHVPYGERFPAGVVESNVLAAEQLLRVAAASAVEVFVYPSSDKSVQPPSLYGATKRLCEALVQRQARAADGRRWVLTRYVNIIGTRGSVIETFTGQVLGNVPLTLTDERMTRYWISMDEALWLLLETTRAAENGSLLMADCGEPVPVVETAQRVAAWYRPRVSPYMVKTTGIRPGERLHELLFSEHESFAPSESPGLLTVRTSREPWRLDIVDDVVPRLRALVDNGGSRDAIRDLAMQTAEALQ